MLCQSTPTLARVPSFTLTPQRKSSRLAASLAALSLPVFCQPAAAGLLFYESFPSDPDEDQVVRLGGWKPEGGTNNADVVADSLSFTDAAGFELKTFGNKALLDGDQGSATVSNFMSVNLQPDGETSGVRWLSFLGVQTAGTKARFFNVVLRGADDISLPADPGTTPDEFLAAGMSSGQETQTWQIWDRTTGTPQSGVARTTSLTTAVTFVVVKMELDAVGVSERFTIWINPRLDQTPQDANGLSFLTTDSNFALWSDVTQVRIGAGAFNSSGPGSAFLVDEIRIGTSWRDVAPVVIPLPEISLEGEPVIRKLVFKWMARSGFFDQVETSVNGSDWSIVTGTSFPLTGQAQFSAPEAMFTVPRRLFRVRRTIL